MKTLDTRNADICFCFQTAFLFVVSGECDGYIWRSVTLINSTKLIRLRQIGTTALTTYTNGNISKKHPDI